MASQPTLSTPSAAPLVAGTPTHPVYDVWAAIWRKLVYVYEGSGPFLDGTALIAHPREWLDHHYVTEVYEEETNPDGTITRTGNKRKIVTVNPNPSKPGAKLLERRKLARYENVAAPIIDHKLAALFREAPTRRVFKGDDKKQEHPYLEWAEDDVDGAGTNLTTYMREAWRIAGILGHAVIVMDRVTLVDEPRTKADIGPPVLRLYCPLDMPDWLQDDTGALTAVKLFEAAPRTDLDSRADIGSTRYRLRYLDGETFKLVEETAKQTARGPKVLSAETIRDGAHGFGRLPVVVLYAKRRALTPLIGQSVLYDPQMFYDLYNLTSELRELLRKQTFSLLNIPLGTGPDAMDVEKAKALAGEVMGTNSVLFSGTPATYITASSENVTAYQDEINRLLRTIFRLANVPWESDSKDAEAAGSLKLKREDMNQVLAGHADELQRAELSIAELFFRATYGDAWEKEWDAAEPDVTYPDTFDTTPMDEVLEQAQAALALPLGRSKTFMLEHSKRMVGKFLADAPQQVLDAVFAELAALPDPEEERVKQREAEMLALTGQFEDKGGEEDDDGGDKPPRGEAA